MPSPQKMGKRKTSNCEQGKTLNPPTLHKAIHTLFALRAESNLRQMHIRRVVPRIGGSQKETIFATDIPKITSGFENFY